VSTLCVFAVASTNFQDAPIGLPSFLPRLINQFNEQHCVIL
jgi:hypothetical protein